MGKLFSYRDANISVLDDLVRGNTVELGRGDVISKIDIRDTPGPYPIYSSSAQNNGKMGEYGKYMFDEEMITWSVDGGGKFFYRPKHKFSVTNVCGYLRLKSKLLDYRYLHSVLEFQHDRLSFDYQTKAHPSVIRELYQVPLLDIREQKKIAEILTSVDEVIENTQSQINKLEDLKKATMNELMTRGIGHTEFKDTEIGRVPASWKLVRCDEVLDLRVGYAFKSSLFKSFGTKLLRGENVGYGNLIWENTCHLDEGQLREYSQYLMQDGDIVIGMDRTFTKSGTKISRIRNADVPCLLVQRVGKFTTQSFDYDFLWHLLKSDLYLNQLIIYQKGMDIPHLSKSEILSPIVPLVPMSEQLSMVKVLDEMDQRVHGLRMKDITIRNLKYSLMQDLLTGKVRVTVN